MSASTQEDEEEGRWLEFVEIGNTIHKLHAEARLPTARLALDLVGGFHISKVHEKTLDRIRQFRQLLPKIAEYLDADPTIMKTTISYHFRILHYKSGLTDEEWKDIVWGPKPNGTQFGLTFVINATRYFVKTHQFGPASGSQRSIRPPDLKEIFIYRLLQYIGIGPEADFVFPTHGSQRALYIVTKDAKLQLLADLSPTTVNMTALLQMDLISRILCIRDCTTNSSNCGQVGEKPMIIDFRIETQSGGYSKPDILEKVYEGNGEFSYVGLMRSAVLQSNEFKLNVIKQSLADWNLELSIDKATADSIHLKTIAVANGLKFDDDLAKYIGDIKKTIEVLQGVA